MHCVDVFSVLSLLSTLTGPPIYLEMMFKTSIKQEIVIKRRALSLSLFFHKPVTNPAKTCIPYITI